MRRTVRCPECGVEVQSKFARTTGDYPHGETTVHWLRYCPCCGTRLVILRGERGSVTGARAAEEWEA